jgi:lipopolysaccharide transport system ATP-binding protein
LSASITAEHLGVRFLLDRHRRPVTPFAARVRRHCSTSWGVRGLDFHVDAGESVALVGPNGAGKTTLLRAIARVLPPDEGGIEVHGRVGPLLSVEAGLTPLLTGRESCRLLGVLSGLTRAQAEAALGPAKRYSALGEAFERPVSSYSAGMRARLGLAVADQTDPDLLLLDEVHEALDQRFRRVMQERIAEVLDRHGIVVAAGHDLDLLGRYCRRAIRLEGGRIAADGGFEEVTAAYLDEVAGRFRDAHTSPA